MPLYDEVRELLEAAKNSTDLGAFAGIVRDIAEPDEAVDPSPHELSLLVITMLGAQADAILRLAREIDHLNTRVTHDDGE